MQRLVLVSLAAVAVLAAAPTALLSQGSQAAPAPASPPGPVKIAFISSQEILQRTPGYAVAESTYRKELQTAQNEVQRLQQQLDSSVQVFEAQSIGLSPAARAAKQKDLQTLQQRVEQRSNELQDRLRQREQELLGPLRARINSVIQGIRAELNYSVIFDADAAGGFIAAADPALNITSRVLQRLAQAQ
jgi:outer membrane protein